MTMRPRHAARGALAAIVLAGCAGGHRTSPPSAPSVARTYESNRISRLAQQAQAEGDDERAIELYRRAIAVSADDAAAWNNLGGLLIRRGRYLEGVEACRRAADLSPTDPRPLFNVGQAYAEAGWHQKAFDYYVQALERDARDVRSLRGAIGSGKMIGVADEAALERVRAALMADTDPDWRRIYESERTRIEGELSVRKRRASGS